MVINGDGGYGLLAAYTGGPAVQVIWLGHSKGRRVNSRNGSAMMTAL